MENRQPEADQSDGIKYRNFYWHINWRELGEQCLKQRISLGFTVSALSILTGLSDAWIARIEAGHDGNVEINRLLLLCSELEINLRAERFWELREDKPSISGLKDYRE